MKKFILLCALIAPAAYAQTRAQQIGYLYSDTNVSKKDVVHHIKTDIKPQRVIQNKSSPSVPGITQASQQRKLK